MTTVVPHYVAEARARKAAALAEHLRVVGFTVSDVAQFTDEDRRDAERGAEVKRKGSNDTWRVVIGMLAGSSAPEALCLTCGIGDPLGVDGPRKSFGHQGPCAR